MVISTLEEYKKLDAWLEVTVFSKNTPQEQWNKLFEVLKAVEKFEKENPELFPKKEGECTS